MGAVHQYVAGYAFGDAISNHARCLRDIFRRWGHDSAIYAHSKFIHPALWKDSLPIETHRPDPEDLVVLHLSIGSAVNHRFRDLACRKAIIYHNVTPHHFFLGVADEIAHQLKLGREEVAMLAGVAEVNMAVSAYNAGELEELGYRDVRVVPLVIDLERITTGATSGPMARDFKEPRTTVCFVGRVAPNKCIEDLVYAFYYYQKYENPNSRFLCAGSYGATMMYKQVLEMYRQRLELEEFHILGSMTEKELRTVFRMSDLFLCMSEHEGVCIPLLEAMQAQLPVLAYAAAAIPETMDGAGVLLREKNWPHAAKMMARLAQPGEFRDRVVAGQNQRLQRYRDQDLETRLKEALGPLL